MDDATTLRRTALAPVFVSFWNDRLGQPHKSAMQFIQTTGTAAR
jgi:hypothetical protein